MEANGTDTKKLDEFNFPFYSDAPLASIINQKLVYFHVTNEKTTVKVYDYQNAKFLDNNLTYATLAFENGTDGLAPNYLLNDNHQLYFLNLVKGTPEYLAFDPESLQVSKVSDEFLVNILKNHNFKLNDDYILINSDEVSLSDKTQAVTVGKFKHPEVVTSNKDFYVVSHAGDFKLEISHYEISK